MVVFKDIPAGLSHATSFCLSAIGFVPCLLTECPQTSAGSVNEGKQMWKIISNAAGAEASGNQRMFSGKTAAIRAVL